MLVVLDTNIVMENWAFDKSYHRAFIDYIATVNCEVVFPQIVWSEIRAKYCSDLKDALNKLASANRNVSKHFFNDIISPRYLQDEYIEVEKAYEVYASQLLELLQGGEHSITEYPRDILPILAEKAIARFKPFSNSGEEFRDAILWHSVLELAKEYDDLSPIVLISKNTKEFADPANKNVLHPELKYETEQIKDCQILYYQSLEEFIKAHLAPIQHVDYAWVKNLINKLNLNDVVLEYIRKRKDKILQYLKLKYREIIIDIDLEESDFELSGDGLSYNYHEETIYTYKNGDSSLFVEYSGTVLCYAGYFPGPSHVTIDKFDGVNYRVLTVDNFTAQKMTLSHRFRVQIEFIIINAQLVSSNVVSMDTLAEPGWDGRKPAAPINSDDDNDLPF